MRFVSFVVFNQSGNRLRESPEFELFGIVARDPGLFDKAVEKQSAMLGDKIAGLKAEAEKLGREIGELAGGNKGDAIAGP